MARIVDATGRQIDYARISVTDRCNYRCLYCMPEDGVPQLDHAEILRYEEIVWLCRVLSELGVRKVRFTGGEPLVRRGMVSFLSEFRRSLPDMAVSLTTNGSLLSRYAADLARVPLAGLNVSLDTVSADKFRRVTRVGDIRDVTDGLRAARDAGVRNIKTNTVLIRGFNDLEMPDILRHAWAYGAVPRLIEFMPLGDDVWKREKFIGAPEILRMLGHMGNWIPDATPVRDGAVPMGPAKYYVDPGTGHRVGVIEAVSNHFCAACNRLRITASGHMKSCLFAETETPLLPLVRARDAQGVTREILEGIHTKPRHWEDIRSGTLHMSGIGG